MCRRYLSPWKGQDIRASVLQGPMTCFPRQHQAWEVDSWLHGQGPCQKRSRSNPAPAMALALDQTPQIHCKSPKVKALGANEKTFALVCLLLPIPQTAHGCLLIPYLHPAHGWLLTPSPICTSFPYPQSAHDWYSVLYLQINLIQDHLKRKMALGSLLHMIRL